MSYYHHIPGRLRFRSSLVKGRTEATESIRELLFRCSGVQTVSASAVTGSVVVEYDTRTGNLGDIFGTLKEHGYFDREQASSADQYMNDLFSKAGSSVGKAVFTTMLERAFPNPAISLIAALL